MRIFDKNIDSDCYIKFVNTRSPENLVFDKVVYDDFHFIFFKLHRANTCLDG